jgi:lysozyme family protein
MEITGDVFSVFTSSKFYYQSTFSNKPISIMADFSTALQKVLQNEGGYVNDPKDPGGETYKGIARNMNKKWDGWAIIDAQKAQPDFPANLDSNSNLAAKIAAFYQANYWAKIGGDKIANDDIGFSIFDFAVNAGTGASIMLAQKVVSAVQDGVMGDDTLAKINAPGQPDFIAAFTVAKISRYVSIVEKRPSSEKYFFGWVRRALGN